ncbi:uncharacterized protein EDB93DRAFT_1099855 [Suillus bovinus]|uniref:uncharacterized protein n=1 Tax=Suillus bovinus TaxID=48563 RepID=UPI001B861700|nr:uncharacterized protein EDB93DRAFT_1099855 [Suillus bovinus]KAG2159500.1 hypothetical protein EDB93DRAFT_1099855 [Suillus bovinus]
MKMIEVFKLAEDLENAENLQALCSLMQTILVMIHDHGLYEHILDNSVFFGAVDIMIQKKIHHTYCLQFLKDVILVCVLDDSTFNVLNSCIIYNQINIINHVQQDTMFLCEILSLYVNEEVLTGGKDKDEKRKDMDVDGKPNGTRANGSTPRPFSFCPPDNLLEHELTLRREVLVLIQQLCIMGKNVPLAAHISLFLSLVNRSILFAVRWAFSLSENDPEVKTTISIAGEVMSALLNHDLNGVQNHITKQASAIKRESKEDLALQCQVGDALKTMLDVSPKDGPELTPQLQAGLNIKLLCLKDDPGTEKFLDYFYKRCIELLFKPFHNIPDFKTQTEPVLKLLREKTNLYLYLSNLHGFCIHFSMLSSNISARMASFLKAQDKHLRLSTSHSYRVLLFAFSEYAFFIFCANVMDSPYRLASPVTIDPETGKPYGPEFPQTSIHDDMQLHKLILDHLGISSVAVVIGGSMGRMAVLKWPLCTPPGYVRHIITLATSAQHSAWCISWGEAQELVVIPSPDGHDGFLLEFEQINMHILRFLRREFPGLYERGEEDFSKGDFVIKKTSLFGEAEVNITRW